MSRIQIAVMVFLGDRIVFPRFMMDNETSEECPTRGEGIFTFDLKFINSVKDALAIDPLQISAMFKIRHNAGLKDVVSASFKNIEGDVTRVWYLATLDVCEAARDLLLSGSSIHSRLPRVLIDSMQYDDYCECQESMSNHELYAVANSNNWYMEEQLQKEV